MKHGELAAELRHIAEEIRPLTDSVDSLYLLLQHVWQNRDELISLLHGPDAAQSEDHEECDEEQLPPETVFCTCCDAVSDTSLARALRAGWQCTVDDEGNERGNYAGVCPACIDEEERCEAIPSQQPEDDMETDPSREQKRLFD